MIVPISRRLLALSALALTSVLAASSCSSVTKDAARFEGESLANRDFDELLVGYATAVPEAFLASGNIDVEIARGVLQNWISTQAILAVLQEAKVEITDDDRSTALANLQQEEGFTETSQVVQDFYVIASASQAAAQREFSLSEADLAAIYETNASQSGAVCLRAILTSTQEEIAAVTARLDAGEDFASVAAEASIDSSATNGGALTNQTSGSACLDQATFESQVTPEFLTALADAPVGQPTAAFEIPTVGWVVLLIRPFDEVADDVAALIGGNGALEAGRAELSTAKIWVSPEYGRWDPATLGVVSAG